MRSNHWHDGYMKKNETPQERKQRFKAMSSEERRSLIREKLRAHGLEEGSGIPGKNLSSYDRDEIWHVIQVTSCLSEMKQKNDEKKLHSKKNGSSLLGVILLSIAFTAGIVIYYEQYPSAEIRRELSVDGMFID